MLTNSIINESEELEPDLTDYLEQVEAPAKGNNDTQDILHRISQELLSIVRYTIQTFRYDDTSQYAYERIADHIYEAFEAVLKRYKTRNLITDYLNDVSVSQGVLMADAYIQPGPGKSFLRFCYIHNLDTNEFIDYSFEEDN